MSAWKRVTAREAQDRLAEIIDEVVGDEPNDGYEITVEGAVVAVLISADEYEKLTSTAEILSDPEVMRRHVDGLGEVEKGDVFSADELEAMLRDPGRLPPGSEQTP